ncbi:hypothetical protein BC834DRAFT_965383 [Gloeopeniophorella convolvens]|nr:hypothetical protein BC834DRAFT_965383 [Gloeopeniophorella convolvens]
MSTTSVHDLDDVRSIASTHESFIDFSPSSPGWHVRKHTSRARSGTVGSEDSTTPLNTPRSTIRINTNVTLPGRKPPLPTAPKPDFRRSSIESSRTHIASQSAPVTAVDRAPRASSGFVATLHERPPTTNYLNAQERADLVRKSRKLTQLLGETPSPLSVSSARGPERYTEEAPSSWGIRHRVQPSWASRPSMRSVDSFDSLRRHSTPLSPAETRSLADLSLAGTGRGMERKERRKGRGEAGEVMDSTSSFIDLSDDDGPSHSGLSLSSLPLPSPPLSRPLDSPDSMFHTHFAEEDRKRRREKVAKLHRFLGSRVPTSLVLGLADDANGPLPALSPVLDDAHTERPLRRRSSSAAEFKSNWFDADDRVKEDLDEHEKAINVRRAIKMEKMFGVQPPQTLYHTRHSPRPTDRVRSTERSSLSEQDNVSPTGRNVNQSAYLNKGGQGRRPASTRSDSSHNLLESEAGESSGRRGSAVYMHYRYSLNSLNDIIDRDDRESLAELHRVLTTDQPVVEGEHATTPTRDDDAKAVRAERRRSLPTRSSTLSLASQFNLGSTPTPEMTSFQVRRRQAAKLTNFFGVDYRELIGDILESIEHDVQEESHRGSLQPDEVQDLMAKLRNLKTKRTAVV